MPYAKLDDPQTLNLYSYVRNNPLNTVDRDGHLGCGFLWLKDCPPPPPPKPQAAPTNPVYGTVDQAGVAAAKADKQQTDARRATGSPVEFGNNVYMLGGVAYTYTDPVTSNRRGTVNPNRTHRLVDPPSIPDGTVLVGEAHSHSDTFYYKDGSRASPRDQLSPKDRNRTLSYPDYQKQFQAEYVALPDGTIIRYDIHDKTTVMK